MTNKVKIIEDLRKAGDCLLDINNYHPSREVLHESAHIYDEVLKLIEKVRKEISENE